MKKECNVVMLATNDIEWKDIIAYKGLYQVSNTGLVRSLDREVFRASGKYIRKGKILSQGKQRHGYLTVGLTINSKTITYYVHRLVTQAFIPRYLYDRNLDVNHKDSNKENNHINNLEIVTKSANSKHAIENKLYKPNYYKYGNGEGNPNSKLTEIEVKEILSKYIPYKYPANKLAKEYNVSQSCIEHIINRTSWTNNVE
jgi:hypothetical protein